MSPSAASRTPAAQMTTAWLTRPGGLADRLKLARVGAGYRSGSALARELGWQQSKVSRLENGVTPPTPEDVDTWARACKLPAAERRELARMATDAQARQLHFGATLNHADHQSTALAIHRGATNVTVWESYAVPGPLQTEPYARAMLTAWSAVLDTDPTTIAEGAAIRAQRRAEVLDPAKSHRFIIAEAVLAWAYGGPAVMADQLDAIVEAVELPSVSLQVIPFGEVAVPIGLGVNLFDDVATWEHWTGNALADANEFATVLKALESAALDQVASAELVRSWADRYRVTVGE